MEEQGLYEVEDDSDMHQGGGRGRQVWTDADLADMGCRTVVNDDR